MPFDPALGGATSIPCARPLRLALGVLVLVGMPAWSQTIAGRVLDQVTHQIAAPVGIRVIDEEGLVIGTATTDRTGVFYVDLTRPACVRVVFDLDSLRAFSTDTLSVGEDGYVEREFLVPFASVFLEFQVERPVTERRGNVLHYPPALRGRNEPGSVLAQFIVDTSGLARMTSFRVLRSTHPDFTMAVQHALPGFHFQPAVMNGQKVAQLVQLPFDFAIERGHPDLSEPGRDPFPRPVRDVRSSRPVP